MPLHSLGRDAFEKGFDSKDGSEQESHCQLKHVTAGGWIDVC